MQVTFLEESDTSDASSSFYSALGAADPSKVSIAPAVAVKAATKAAQPEPPTLYKVHPTIDPACPPFPARIYSLGDGDGTVLESITLSERDLAMTARSNLAEIAPAAQKSIDQRIAGAQLWC